MNCPNCGMELGHETEYCINCGTKQGKVKRFFAKSREQDMFNRDVVTGSSTYTPNRSTTGPARKNASGSPTVASLGSKILDELRGAGLYTDGPKSANSGDKGAPINVSTRLSQNDPFNSAGRFRNYNTADYPEADDYCDSEHMQAELDMDGRKNNRDASAFDDGRHGSRFARNTGDAGAQRKGGNAGANGLKKVFSIIVAIVVMVVVSNLRNVDFENFDIGAFLASIFNSSEKSEFAYTESATVTADELGITYTYVGVEGQNTAIALYIDNTAGNIALPNGESSYQYNAEVLCDGADKDAYMHLTLAQIDGKDIVMCDVSFENAKLFKQVYMALPLVVDGDSTMRDAYVEVEDYRWIK